MKSVRCVWARMFPVFEGRSPGRLADALFCSRTHQSCFTGRQRRHSRHSSAQGQTHIHAPRGGSLIGKISPRTPTQTGPHLEESQPAKHSSHDISVSHLLDSRPVVGDGPGVGLLPELKNRERACLRIGIQGGHFTTKIASFRSGQTTVHG